MNRVELEKNQGVKLARGRIPDESERERESCVFRE